MDNKSELKPVGGYAPREHPKPSGAKRAGIAAIIASLGVVGGRATAPEPIASYDELRELSKTPMDSSIVVGRFHLGRLESVLVAVPNERWSVKELEDYVKKLELLKDRVNYIIQQKEK